ncbi:MAG TPA: Gfo/Idh/MocA family oxidoreductase [Gaiellales bacterium]|nr:Gfo/Idh/MocA family oxidoreductase [Gaiellales bacterium]
MEALRIGLLGTGWVMDRHARAVNAHARARLVAAANWRQPSLDAFAERHAIPRTTTDWRQLAADPEVDAVVVGTPNALHASQAIACLAAGKHVLVEKPMATGVVEAAAMNEAAEASPGTLMVGHCWRFHPDVRALRDRVAGGELGEVVKTRGYGVHVRWGPSGWFVRRDLAGGGALADMGVHAIDTARFVIGDPQPLRVAAEVGTRYGDYDVEDDGILLVAWSNHVNSIIESGWWQPFAGGLEADTEVYGTGGYGRVWTHTEAPDDSYEHCPQSMYNAQMAEFVDAVLEGRRPQPDGVSGAVVMSVLEQAYRAAGVVR